MAHQVVRGDAPCPADRAIATLQLRSREEQARITLVGDLGWRLDQNSEAAPKRTHGNRVLLGKLCGQRLSPFQGRSSSYRAERAFDRFGARTSSLTGAIEMGNHTAITRNFGHSQCHRGTLIGNSTVDQTSDRVEAPEVGRRGGRCRNFERRSDGMPIPPMRRTSASDLGVSLRLRPGRPRPKVKGTRKMPGRRFFASS